MDMLDKELGRETALQEWMDILTKTRQMMDAGDVGTKILYAISEEMAEQIIEKQPFPIRPEYILHSVCSRMCFLKYEVLMAQQRELDTHEFEVLLNLTSALLVERIRS